MTAAEAVYAKGQVRLIEDSAQALRSDTPSAGTVELVERIIAQAVGLWGHLEADLRRCWCDLRASPRDYPAQAVGEQFTHFLQHALLAFDPVESAIRAAEAAGLPVPSAALFREARGKAFALHDWFRASWPMQDVEAIETARQQFQAGESVKLGDLVRALDAVD